LNSILKFKLKVPVTSTYHAGPMLYLSNLNSWLLTPHRVNEDDGSAEPSVMELRDVIRSHYVAWKRKEMCSADTDTDTDSTGGGGDDDDDDDKSKYSITAACWCCDGLLSLDHADIKERTKQAREDVVHKFSPKQVAAIMHGRVLSALSLQER
jgi:hypothetical protein